MGTSKRFQIAVVEDNPYYNKILTGYLKNLCKKANYPDFDVDIQSFLSAEDCINNIDKETNLLILDYYLQNDTDNTTSTGLDVLKKINRDCRNCKVIVVSEQGSLTVTAELFKNGIYDYIEKDNHSADRVWGVVQKLMKEEAQGSSFFQRLFEKQSRA